HKFRYVTHGLSHDAIIAGKLAAPGVHNCRVPELAVAALQDAAGRRRVAGPAAGLRPERRRVVGPAVGLRPERRRVAGPAGGLRHVAALFARLRSGLDAEKPAVTAARESASPALARLPVAELAPPPLGRPVPLVSVKVSELVENIPSPARGVRSSAGLEGDPA